MSSIMRWRNGLMAWLVIGDAPALNEVVENPQSQGRTPRRAISLILLPAPMTYRASGLDAMGCAARQWHHRRGNKAMERPMAKQNDLSRCLVTLEQDATVIAVIEMGQSSWLVAGIV